MRLRVTVTVTVFVAAVSMWTGTALATTRCEDLTKLSLAETTISSATSVAAGTFVPPTYRGSFGAQTGVIIYGQVDYARLPAFCQVMARLHPTTDSDITIEMWLSSLCREWGTRRAGTKGEHGFTFDSAAIIEAWKDTGKAPDHLIVTHLRNGREVGKRLVCQYPQVAMYKGAGDTEDPASFVCK